MSLPLVERWRVVLRRRRPEGEMRECRLGSPIECEFVDRERDCPCDV